MLTKSTIAVMDRSYSEPLIMDRSYSEPLIMDRSYSGPHRSYLWPADRERS